MRVARVGVELKFKLDSGEGCQALGARRQLRGRGGDFQLRGWEAPSGAGCVRRAPKHCLDVGIYIIREVGKSGKWWVSISLRETQRKLLRGTEQSFQQIHKAQELGKMN